MVRGEIHVYYSPEAAKLALELPLLSVDGLVLLQGVLVGKRLAANLTGELRLAVALLVLPQCNHGICAEDTVWCMATKLWPGDM